MKRLLLRLTRSVFLILIVLISLSVVISIGSCSSPKTFALSCQERQIEIYVDNQYLGRDLVYYTP